MKTILFCLISVSCSAQIYFGSGAIELKNDTLSVEQGFKLLRDLTPAKLAWVDLYFTKGDTTYYQPGFSFIRRRTYVMTDRGPERFKKE